MDRTKEVARKLRKYVAPNYSPLSFRPERCDGVWVYGFLKGERGGSERGHTALDMTSTYSALSLGHNHPDIVHLKEFRLRAKKPSKTSRGIVMHGELADLAEKLVKLCGMEMMIPKNAGTEIFDTAVKAARMWKHKVRGGLRDNAEIIICKRAFHGRSGFATDASSDDVCREGFGPFAPWWAFPKVPFGDVQALASAINGSTAAFIVEPIQAEAGIIVPPQGYLREAKRVCRENGIFFILDEIQTGLGRTGNLFAWQHDGPQAKPDAILLGKALGGGEEKISALVGSRELIGVLTEGTEGSTFGGDPSSCAIASKVLDLLSDKELLGRVEELGAWLMEQLLTINSPLIKEVRGRGLLIGLELHEEAGGARRFCAKLLERGVLCKETHGNVIRFAPPLIVAKKELEWAFERIKSVLEEG